MQAHNSPIEVTPHDEVPYDRQNPVRQIMAKPPG